MAESDQAAIRSLSGACGRPHRLRLFGQAAELQLSPRAAHRESGALRDGPRSAGGHPFRTRLGGRDRNGGRRRAAGSILAIRPVQHGSLSFDAHSVANRRVPDSVARGPGHSRPESLFAHRAADGRGQARADDACRARRLSRTLRQLGQPRRRLAVRGRHPSCRVTSELRDAREDRGILASVPQSPHASRLGRARLVLYHRFS